MSSLRSWSVANALVCYVEVRPTAPAATTSPTLLDSPEKQKETHVDPVAAMSLTNEKVVVVEEAAEEVSNSDEEDEEEMDDPTSPKGEMFPQGHVTGSFVTSAATSPFSIRDVFTLLFANLEKQLDSASPVIVTGSLQHLLMSVPCTDSDVDHLLLVMAHALHTALLSLSGWVEPDRVVRCRNGASVTFSVGIAYGKCSFLAVPSVTGLSSQVVPFGSCVAMAHAAANSRGQPFELRYHSSIAALASRLPAVAAIVPKDGKGIDALVVPLSRQPSQYITSSPATTISSMLSPGTFGSTSTFSVDEHEFVQRFAGSLHSASTTAVVLRVTMRSEGLVELADVLNTIHHAALHHKAVVASVSCKPVTDNSSVAWAVLGFPRGDHHVLPTPSAAAHLAHQIDSHLTDGGNILSHRLVIARGALTHATLFLQPVFTGLSVHLANAIAAAADDDLDVEHTVLCDSASAHVIEKDAFYKLVLVSNEVGGYYAVEIDTPEEDSRFASSYAFLFTSLVASCKVLLTRNTSNLVPLRFASGLHESLIGSLLEPSAAQPIDVSGAVRSGKTSLAAAIAQRYGFYPTIVLDCGSQVHLKRLDTARQLLCNLNILAPEGESPAPQSAALLRRSSHLDLSDSNLAKDGDSGESVEDGIGERIAAYLAKLNHCVLVILDNADHCDGSSRKLIRAVKCPQVWLAAQSLNTPPAPHQIKSASKETARQCIRQSLDLPDSMVDMWWTACRGCPAVLHGSIYSASVDGFHHLMFYLSNFSVRTSVCAFVESVESKPVFHAEIRAWVARQLSQCAPIERDVVVSVALCAMTSSLYLAPADLPNLFGVELRPSMGSLLTVEVDAGVDRMMLHSFMNPVLVVAQQADECVSACAARLVGFFAARKPRCTTAVWSVSMAVLECYASLPSQEVLAHNASDVPPSLLHSLCPLLYNAQRKQRGVATDSFISPPTSPTNVSLFRDPRAAPRETVSDVLDHWCVAKRRRLPRNKSVTFSFLCNDPQFDCHLSHLSQAYMYFGNAVVRQQKHPLQPLRIPAAVDTFVQAVDTVLVVARQLSVYVDVDLPRPLEEASSICNILRSMKPADIDGCSAALEEAYCGFPLSSVFEEFQHLVATATKKVERTDMRRGVTVGVIDKYHTALFAVRNDIRQISTNAASRRKGLPLVGRLLKRLMSCVVFLFSSEESIMTGHEQLREKVGEVAVAAHMRAHAALLRQCCEVATHYLQHCNVIDDLLVVCNSLLLHFQTADRHVGDVLTSIGELDAITAASLKVANTADGQRLQVVLDSKPAAPALQTSSKGWKPKSRRAPMPPPPED